MPSLVKDKSGVFFIVYSVNGKRVWRSTFTRQKREAYAIFLEARTPDKRITKSELLIADHVRDYIAHVKANMGSKTYEIYELAMSNFMKYSGNVPLSEINSHTIDKYKISRLEKVSPATVNLEVRTIRAFFNCLKRWEVTTKNPCDGISQVRVSQQTPAYLTQDQLLSFLPSIKDPWLKPIVQFAAMTGTRLGEILNLTWENVDLSSRTATIQSSVSYQVKCGKVRTIPLNQTALEVLLQAQERTGLVFAGKRGGAANPNHVSASFRKAARHAGLDKRLHFHSLRHTFASLLVQKGISLYQVQKLLGHSSSRMTEVYAHLQGSNLHSVVESIQL